MIKNEKPTYKVEYTARIWKWNSELENKKKTEKRNDGRNSNTEKKENYYQLGLLDDSITKTGWQKW